MLDYILNLWTFLVTMLLTSARLVNFDCNYNSRHFLVCYNFDESVIVDLKSLVNFTDVIIIDTHNGPPKDTEQEIKHLNQVIITKQQELDVKKLEKTDTEMKIQKKILELDKGYLHSELNKLNLKLETLKGKKKDIEEQIREVQRSLLQTYYSGISSNSL